ncbi:hypothetical protein TIFTF001_034209 [Ficus carica]|uniref:Uncharacterized protein n=1 Tax=Ficus carica TaxID=3494 RepID=A0AA88DZZ3_FICCA|nr:hypothetical protein TIFTF001_034209 [Ficus carica]
MAYVRWVVTELVSERVPAFWSHSLPASATVITRTPICFIEIRRFIATCTSDDTLVMSRIGARTQTSLWVTAANGFEMRCCLTSLYDLGDPEMHALHLLRGGLPPNVRLFILEPMAGMTLEDMMSDIMEAEIIAHMMQVAAMEDDYVVPVDDAGIAEPLFHGGPVMPEDPILAMPLQAIPPQEAVADAVDDEMDPVDVPIDQEENPEDPPIIIIKSDDEEEVEEEQEEWDHGHRCYDI